MAKNNRSGRNNNPEGRNQYSSSGWMDTAKDKPFTTAAAAAAAVGAGVFLWSKRNQISDQISNLSGQLHDWADEMRSGNANREMAMAEETEGAMSTSGTTTARKSGSAGRSSSNRSSRGQSRSSQSMTAGAEQITH